MTHTRRIALLLCASIAPLPLLAGAAHAERHAVFNLVDNRPLAHLQRRGGLYLDAGSAGFARYVHFSRPIAVWKLRQKEDGRGVALAQAVVTVEAPLNYGQAQARVVHLGLKAPTASTVKVTARDKGSAAIALKPGWQIVTIALPDGALEAGENTLRFNFANAGNFGGGKAYAAVEFIQIGGSAPAQADPAMRGAELKLPKDGGATFYTFLPDGGALRLSGNAGGCKLVGKANGGADAELPLDGSEIEFSRLPGAAPGKWNRLDLLAQGGCDAVTIARGELLGPGGAPQLAGKQPPRNVILWLSDSTRADKFRIYNPKTRVETPFFDELAKKATVFKVAYVQGNESRVSHASLFSGTYPSVHNMIPEKAKLKPEFTIIPEAVKASGRTTMAAIANGYISKFWGFGDGWDSFRNNIHEGGGLSGVEMLGWAKKLIGQFDAKPWFLYIGSIDAHVSWRAREPWLSKYDPEPYNGRFVKACLDPDLDKIVAGQLAVNDRDKVRVRALYDSDISYTDNVIKQLFDDLGKRNRLNDTMFIFTADHGEEFWDHGKIGHGQSLKEELVHVPLVIYYPPYFPARAVEEGVDVLDILPTITDALGAPTPAAAQGESLIPLAQGVGGGYPRPTIASQYELAHTIRMGPYKMFVGGSGKVELFDVNADPLEQKDISASRPVERRAMTDAMGTWMAFRNQWNKRKWGVSSNLAPAFAADMEK